MPSPNFQNQAVGLPVEVSVNWTDWPADGSLGEYFETGQQSPQAFRDGSLGEYFETGQRSPQAFRDGSLGGLSVFDFASPAGGALKAARLRGLGEDSEKRPASYEPRIPDQQYEMGWRGMLQRNAPDLYGPAGLALVAGMLLVGALLNYQQGKAMAPSADKKKTWGWIAVPVGFLPLGLPIMAIVSNAKQGR